jgi:hypothetical protein
MIVPLSLSFSEDFNKLRALLYSNYKINWFSHFARIPAALFAADVRVRNTIHIGKMDIAIKASYINYSSRLHRWFKKARPDLFNTLLYATFEQKY